MRRATAQTTSGTEQLGENEEGFHSCNLCSYAILKDQQKEAGIGPKKRKGQDAHDSSEDSEMQVIVVWGTAHCSYLELVFSISLDDEAFDGSMQQCPNLLHGIVSQTCSRDAVCLVFVDLLG